MVSDEKLPTYEVPPFDGIGRQRVTSSTWSTTRWTSSRPSTTPAPWELNIWYHTLNCGIPLPDQRRDRLPLHPTAKRVGLGRVYGQARRRQSSTSTAGARGSSRAAATSATARATLDRLPIVDRRGVRTARGSGAEARRDPGARSRCRRGWRPNLEPEATPRAPAATATRPARRQAVLGTFVAQRRPRRVLGASTGRGRRHRLPRGAPGGRGRLHVTATSPSTSMVDKSSWIALRIYPSSHTNPVLRRRRRPADPRLEAVGRVVPQGGRPVAGRRRSSRPAPRSARPPSRRTTSRARLQEDPGGVVRGLIR